MTTPRGARLRSTFLPGLVLAASALAVAILIGALESVRLGRGESLITLLTPDDVSAAWTMSLLGTAEGVAIAIVIVVVVLGVQLTADRYSPRIIDIFVRDRMNLVVLALFLGSIVFTITVSLEIKHDRVPLIGVYAAVALAVLDFAVLLPYVRYMFQVMRGETLIEGVRRRAATEIREAARRPELVGSRRDAVREALSQCADIALGSIQEGDTEVALAAIHALRGLVCDDYIPIKARLPKRWFTVSHEDMPGASEQTIVQVDRTGTWLEHAVLATFLDLVGETPAFRKEIIHAIAATTRDIGRRAIHHQDSELEDVVVRFFNTYFRAALNQRAPTFAYSVMNEYRRLAIDAATLRPGLPERIADHMLRYGRAFDKAGMPFIIGTAAEDVAEIVQVLASHDPDRAILLARRLATSLVEMSGEAQALSLNGILKANIKLALWAIAEEHDDVLRSTLVGIAAVDAEVRDTALARMQDTTERVFWEVSDRVVAYDWVEDHLRELIPILRGRLSTEPEAAEERPRPLQRATEASSAPRSA